MSKLNEMILQFRENVGQSVEGLALLMQMDPDEYEELEKEWIPPDDILKKLCSLFEWNYKEIKQLADNSPSNIQKKDNLDSNKNLFIGKKPADSGESLFSKMIIDARKEAKQDQIGIATLIGIPVEYFKEIEEGLLPPNELIRKICTLFGWNYKEINQKINAQSTIQFDLIQPILDPRKIKQSIPDKEAQISLDFEPPIPLSELIQKARIDAGQNVEGISLLLQINPELYEQIEAGEINPDLDLLKRISSLFGWNYHDMLNREKNSNFGQFLPVITKIDSSEKSISEIKLSNIQKEIEEKWTQISSKHQETLLRQLEFLLGSMKNLKIDD